MVDADSEELRRVQSVDATALLRGGQPASEKQDGCHVARPTVRWLEAGRRGAEKTGLSVGAVTCAIRGGLEDHIQRQGKKRVRSAAAACADDQQGQPEGDGQRLRDSEEAQRRKAGSGGERWQRGTVRNGGEAGSHR